VVKAVSDLVDVADRQAGLAQSRGDRLDGKVTRLLVPIETLLRSRRDMDAVHDERRCGVESLHNPVLPFLQPGQCSSLKRTHSASLLTPRIALIC